MCTKFNPARVGQRLVAAYSLIEVMIGTAIMAIMFAGLFAGISFGFTEAQLARENLRATQIILEKMEGIRLYTFDQLTNSSTFASTFTSPYYPLASTNESQGIIFYGSLTLNDPGVGAGYNDNCRLVTVSVVWTNTYGSVQVVRRRDMQTQVARYGVQNYTFYN
jgi:type II secretory pathway pseudopilin PulG